MKTKRHRLPIVVAGCLSLLLIAALAVTWSGRGLAEEQQPVLKLPDYPPTPTFGPPPELAVAPGQELASASFDSLDALAAWQFVDLGDRLPGTGARWTIKDGHLVQNMTDDAGNPSPHETLALTGNPTWTNYTVDVQVYDTYNMAFGVVARHEGDSFYRFRISAEPYGARPAGVLEKVVDGQATTLATYDSAGYQQRSWHTLQMTVEGAQISVRLDGQLVAQAQDTTLSRGRAGVSTTAIGGIYFDNLRVTAK